MATLSSSPLQKKGSSKSSLNTLDLQSIQGITAYARSQGFKDEDILPKEPKLSFLQRLGRGLSAFEPANAFYEAKYEGKNFAIEYIKDILQEGASAITGKEKRAEGDVKRTFKDILVKNGMKDREGKLDWVDVLGLGGDIVTDPTTWFGSGMVKAGGRVLKGGARGVEAVAMKVAPTKTKAITEAFSLAKDALGKAFVPAYGTSKFSKKSGLTILDDIIEEGAETAVEKTTALEKTLIEAAESGMPKEEFISSFLSKNLPTEEATTKMQKLASVYDEIIETSAKRKVAQSDELFESLTKKSIDELEAEKTKLIDAFRKESDLMADTAGAGTRLRKVEDAAGNLTRMVTDFSLPAAKKSMATQKEQAVKYAEEILRESDPYFKQLDDVLQQKRAIEPVNLKEPVMPDFGAPVGKEATEQIGKTMEPTAEEIVRKKIEEMAGQAVDEKVATKELLPQNPILKEFVKEEVAKIIRNDAATVARGLGKYVDEAIKYDSAEDFAKVVTKEELYGEDPIAFYNRVVDKTPLAEKVRSYRNVVQDLQTQVGKKFGKIFKNTPEHIKEDLVDGLMKVRKDFARMRENLIKQGFDQDVITKELVSYFNKIDVNTMFKEAETVSLFVKTIMPELLMMRKMTSEISGLGNDMMMEAYFPFIKKKTIQDFNSSYAKMSNKGYLKRFKGVLDKDDIIIDPAEAYATQAQKVAKDGLTQKFLKEIIEENGKPITAFKNADEAAKAGYRSIKEMGAYGKELGYLKMEDAKYINEIYDPSYRVINNLAKATGYDWTLNLFKKSVTGLFVPFHARNYVSGLLQNYQVLGWKAMKPSNIGRGQTLTWKIMGGSEDIMKKLAQGMDDEAIDTIGKTASKIDDVADPLIQEAKKYKSAEEFVDNKFKTSNQENLYQEIRQIAKESKTPEQIDEKIFNAFGNDPEIILYRGVNKNLSPLAFESDTTSKIGKFWSPNKAHSELFVRGDGEMYEVKVKASDLLKSRLAGKTALPEKEIQLANELQQNAIKSPTKSQLTDIWNKANKVSESFVKEVENDVQEIGGYKVVDIVDAFQKKFGVSSQYISDYGMESMAKLTKEQNKYSPFEIARNVGNYIETQQKATAVVTALDKGYDLTEALRLAEKAGFDYSMLTPFEKNVMRRLIPFYSFARKNIQLQLETMAKNPERIGVLTKAFRAAGSPQGVREEDDELYIPDWMRGRFSVRIGDSKSGLPQMLSGFGTPIEAMGDILDDGLLGAMTMLNPTLKVPIERATGKDFFRKTDLKDVYTAKEYSHAPQFIKDWLKIKEVEKPIFIGGEPTSEKRKTYVADPMRLHIARNLFTSRGISYLDTLFGEEELSPMARYLKSLTGVRPYEVDEEATVYFEDRDNMRDLIDYLKRYGVIKTFERAYVPKDPTETALKKKK